MAIILAEWIITASNDSQVASRFPGKAASGWAYAHGASLRAATWLRGEEVEPMSDRWQSLLVQYG